MISLLLVVLMSSACYAGITGFSDPQDSPQQEKSDLHFGDMVLTAKQAERVQKGEDVSPSKNSFAASNNPYHRWPNAVIPYEFDCSLEFMPSAHEAVRQAMAEWESKTCIRFVKRTNEKDYLHFYRNTHCWGNVGRIGAASRISIGYGCDYRHVMVHEIGHVVGFWHEQNRMDRDDWVKIHWENIDEWVKSAFRKVKESTSYGVPYDYASIMHYPWTAFSKNGKVTMEPLKPVKIQPYQHLSEADALQTSIMYKCNEVMRKRREAKEAEQLAKISYDEGACEDKRSDCAQLTKDGGCQGDPMVFQLCLKTCNPAMCDPSAACKDQHSSCPQWKSWGHCEKSPRVAAICVKSCSPYCNGLPRPKTNPPTAAPPKTDGPVLPPHTSFPPDGPLPTTSSGTVRMGYGRLCRDRHPNCPSWAKRGDCKKSKAVLRNCMISCKVKDCDNGVQKPPGKCATPLGIAFDGKGWKIPDSAITESSYLSPGGGWSAKGNNARLYYGDNYTDKRIAAWCVRSWQDYPNSYLQIDLQEKKTVNYIATQGRDKYYERVSKFKIGYSNNGSNFKFYEEDGDVKVFNGNCDHFTPILNKFKNSISARFIRFYPVEANYPCVRLELYGC